MRYTYRAVAAILLPLRRRKAFARHESTCIVAMHVCNARVQFMCAGQGTVCLPPPIMPAHASTHLVDGNAETCNAHGSSFHPHASAHALPKVPLHSLQHTSSMQRCIADVSSLSLEQEGHCPTTCQADVHSSTTPACNTPWPIAPAGQCINSPPPLVAAYLAGNALACLEASAHSRAR
eukprot:278840-Chlamydomonas_euryale.AAC.1